MILTCFWLFIIEVSFQFYFQFAVYDATAKIPSGVLNGNINQYGDFDQCLGVESASKSFRGQYCLARIMVSLPKSFKYLRYLRKHLMSLEAYRSRFEDVSEALYCVQITIGQ